MSPSAARVGFLKTSQRDCFKPCLGECELAHGRWDVRVWPRSVSGLDIFFIIKILLKTGSAPVWIVDNILRSNLRKVKGIKSRVFWSRPLIGQFLAGRYPSPCEGLVTALSRKAASEPSTRILTTSVREQLCVLIVAQLLVIFFERDCDPS